MKELCFTEAKRRFGYRLCYSASCASSGGCDMSMPSGTFDSAASSNPIANAPVSKKLLAAVFRQCDAAIFQQCDDISLSRLALVCHGFRDTAVPILWSELNDLEPLLRLLPATKVGKKRRNRGGYYFASHLCH